MNCMECHGRFVEQELAGLHLDVCEGCGAVWFDPGELKRFAMDAGVIRTQCEKRIVVDKDQPVDQCPKCLMQELVTADLGDLPLQKCRNCRGMLIAKSTYEAHQPTTTAENVGFFAVDVLVDAGVEGLGYVVEAIIEGALDWS